MMLPRLLLLVCLVAVSAPAAEIINLAGTGKPGFLGDGGPATEAQVNNPFGLIRGPDGAIYFCDTDNHRIRRIDRQGIITTVAGNGMRGYGGDGGPAREAQLNEPYELRFDAKSNLYVVERMNHTIRRIDMTSGIIVTIAGTGKEGFSGDNGPANKAQFKQPHSIQFDRAGNLFVCDIGNHRIRRIDGVTAVVTTFAGTGDRKPTRDGAAIEGTPLNGPRAIDFDSAGNMILALREGNAVYKLDLTSRTIHHLAGTGKQGFTGNGGTAKQATLSGPKGVSIAPGGNIYLADTESHSIRMIDIKTGTIQLVAGTGEKGDGPVGNPQQCRMARPHGVFVDQDGSILIGDSEAHRVRMIRPTK